MRGELASAAQANMERETIFRLARGIRPEVIGFDQAVKELENAVGIALDVIAKGERGTNQEAFVEDILKRLAETTKTGDYDGGAKAVDDAVAEFYRREEEHRAASRRSLETLFEAGVEQDLLRRDPASVARRIEAIAGLDATDGNPAWSKKYRERLDAFYAEGQDKGINLSLEVAIEMARRKAASARDCDQRGAALVLLGNALATLGARESGPARLEEAVSAYREALKETTREREPLDWAGTQMNLGSALAMLGERENGTARLTKAVATYREALKENTRELDEPLLWAKTQNNLGNALAMLGERENGTARLTKAVATYREALKENTRARVPLEWARTQMNLGRALKLLGEREGGTTRLEEAVAAYREALQEWTRARAARLGRDPDESRQYAHSAQRAGEWDGPARGSCFCVPRSFAGIYPRARAGPMGQGPDRSRRLAQKARRAGERAGAARRGCRSLSRGLEGMLPQARAANMGRDPDEPRRCAQKARRTGARDGAAR
jgi:tetratricopeptide (TPR) repeat protein